MTFSKNDERNASVENARLAANENEFTLKPAVGDGNTLSGGLRIAVVTRPGLRMRCGIRLKTRSLAECRLLVPEVLSGVCS